MSTRHLYRLVLPAVLMPFVFGFMESALNGDLPLYAKDVGLPLTVMSMALAAFVIGSLVLQYTLGYLSDRWGRRRILVSCSLIGAVIFAVTPFVDSTFGFTMMFALAGGFVGTLFSLSLAFLSDLVPSNRLHQANRLAMIHFGTGMTLGPILAGGAITWLMPNSLFWSLSVLYILYVVIGLLVRRTFPLAEETKRTRSV
ncbi:MFS transporter [Alicyclobacillus suci]|uniref:MFS transporter n=1 Tax=Alicyclobacillus suci TaxID=2816080 RepID=UPI002E2CE74E|nr:MFS transporter [Alicyclobacillus suci]